MGYKPQEEIHNQTVSLITASLVLVTGMFWQTAIKDTIQAFMPTTGVWAYELLVAFMVTSAVAVLIYALNRTNGKHDK